MTLYNITAAAISLFFVGLILLLVRRQRLAVFHTLWWLFAVAGMLVAGFFPMILDRVGWFLGVQYPPVLPIIIALCFLFVKVLTMDIEKTKQEMKLRVLAQKMAAYDAELRRLKSFIGEIVSDDVNRDD